ncbi:glycosyltransferase family 1 protein [Fibrisoma montanum]|uniref:Glycosyltransferase family 1 protein n=1 Tax=Fibrisoma montanum TaxID=2305895 RepID=A0A418M921_9BACT|nr:glycosyltransferase family 1 protein [Fibrisoma montanum]RIV22589.1 glycosyltransferase family 1 protein [Fibrisoma montanum]
MPHLFLDTERMANLASGMGQFCLHLGNELVRQKPADWQITFLVSREQVGIFGPSAEYLVASRWRRVWHPWKFDVWHCPYQNSRFTPMRKTALVYTILDLNYLFLPEYSDKRKARQKARYQQLVNKAAAVTTISSYVAQDIRKQLVVPPTTPVEVIYLGMDKPTDIVSSFTVKPDGPFLFFIGMLQAYKNVHAMLPLLEAFPNYRLVLAGPDDKPYVQDLRDQATRMGVADRLIIPGPVDEATKWWLYANCDAFLFPSLHEGFGLPVIEAMSFGKPVFCSTLSSVPEVGGPEAFYFPSFDPETVVNVFQLGMETYSNDPEMPTRIMEHSRQFRWEATAAAYWQLYQRVV